MTDSNFDMPPGKPDDERDVFDDIDEAVARITDADIEDSLSETLRRAGYGQGPCPDLTVLTRHTADCILADDRGILAYPAQVDAARRLWRMDYATVARVAREEADKIIAAAREEAQKIIAGAHQEASRILDEAEGKSLTQAAIVTIQSKVQADQIIGNARLAAQRIYADTRHKANKILSDSRREAAQFHSGADLSVTRQKPAWIPDARQEPELTSGRVYVYCDLWGHDEGDLPSYVGRACDGDGGNDRLAGRRVIHESFLAPPYDLTEIRLLRETAQATAGLFARHYLAQKLRIPHHGTAGERLWTSCVVSLFNELPPVVPDREEGGWIESLQEALESLRRLALRLPAFSHSVDVEVAIEEIAGRARWMYEVANLRLPLSVSGALWPRALPPAPEDQPPDGAVFLEPLQHCRVTEVGYPSDYAQAEGAEEPGEASGNCQRPRLSSAREAPRDSVTC